MYQFSPKSQALADRLTAFMNEHIYPNEEAYAAQLRAAENRFAALPLMDELKEKAKAAGLWNLFVPEEHAEYCDHGGLSFLITRPSRKSWAVLSGLLRSSIATRLTLAIWKCS